MNRVGMSLVEILVAMSVVGILGLVFVEIVASSSSLTREQNNRGELEQNLAVVTQILQSDVKSAGYRGVSENSEFSGALQSDVGLRIKAINWLTYNWSKLRVSGSRLDTIQASIISTNPNKTDELIVRKVSKISLKAIAVADIEITEIFYHWDESTELERKERKLVFENVDLTTTATLYAPTPLSLASANATRYQPVAEGVEAFQVFFKQANGVWTADGSRPAANIAVSAVPNANIAPNTLAAIGVYIRLRTPSRVKTSDCEWPKDTAQVLNPTGAAVAWSALGVGIQTYTADDCKYKRLERALTIVPATSFQDW